MKNKDLFTILVLIIIFAFTNCKKDDDNNTTTIPLQTVVQPTIDLGITANYVILAGSLISNVPSSAITGNIGLSPAAGSMITGFGNTEITGTIYTVDATGPYGSVLDELGLIAAKGDLTIAYNNAAGRTSTDIVPLAGNIGGLTLTPGLYNRLDLLKFLRVILH